MIKGTDSSMEPLGKNPAGQHFDSGLGIQPQAQEPMEPTQTMVYRIVKKINVLIKATQFV